VLFLLFFFFIFVFTNEKKNQIFNLILLIKKKGLYKHATKLSVYSPLLFLSFYQEYIRLHYLFVAFYFNFCLPNMVNLGFFIGLFSPIFYIYIIFVEVFIKK
jgi:hypothetical protein